MVAPLAIATGLKAGLAQTGKLSMSITGYDFVGLAGRLLFFYGVAFLIDLYFKAVISGGTFLNLLGLNLPASLPSWLTTFFLVGHKGITFWNIVQVISILIVVVEAFKYERSLKEKGETANTSTLAVFLMIALGLSLVTFPQLLQKFQEGKIISTPVTKGFGGEPL